MKKRMLSALLCLCMMLTMVPAALAADGENSEASDAVAKVGNTEYSTLAAAVDSIIQSDNKSGTVVLQKNASGSGIGLFNGQNANDVNLTIDLGGFTYTCEDPAVGSTGTETQGFHLEKGNTVTIKNGTLNVAENSQNTKMLIQNYCDLTLEDLTLTGSNVTQYIISSNYGDVTMKNVSISGTNSGVVAIDLMHWLNADYHDKAPTMTIANAIENTIKGTIDVYCYGSYGGTAANSCTDKPTLTITGGTFSSDVSQYVADGYTYEQDGTNYVVKAAPMEVENGEVSGEGSVTSSVTGVQIPDSSSAEEGVEATGTTVTVDAQVEDTSDTITTSNVKVSGNTLSALAEADTVSTVKIDTNVGTLAISDTALNAIVTAATTNGAVADVTLTLSIKGTKTEDSDGVNSVTYEFTAKAGSTDVFAGENNGTITVTVPAPDGVGEGDPVYVYYIADDDTRTLEATETVATDKTVTWDVTHFSQREVTNTQDEATYTKGGKEVTGTLQDAVANADKGSTIYLNKYVSLYGTNKGDTEGALTITKNLTIDGRAKHIMAWADSFEVENGGAGPSLINIQNGVNVTLKNLTVNGMGGSGPNDTSGAKHGVNINGNATVTLENVQIIGCRWYGVVCNDGSTLTVDGVESSGHGYGGINVDKGGKVTINDYTSGADESAAVIYENTGDMGGSLTVNGGSFQNIVVQVGESESPAGTVSINGGTFTGTAQGATNSGGIVYKKGSDFVTTPDEGDDIKTVVTITDGTFLNGDNTLVEKLLSEGSSLGDNGEIVPASNSVAAIGGVGYKTLSDALTAANNGTNKTVTLLANATLSSKIESGVTLVVPADKTLTIEKTNYTTLFQSAGTIRVQAGGVISVDDTKMIGGSDANIALTDGYIDLKVDNGALGLSFVGATAEVPTGSRWTLVLGETQMKMNVTLDKSTTLTVNGSKGDDAGFHVANGSTLTNNGKIEVNSSMSIGTSGAVSGSGTITVNAGGVLEASVNNAGTVGTLSNNVTVAGTFVWGGSAANSLTGTVTLASGGKVYSNADIANKLSGDETMSNKTYNGTDYSYAWQYDVPSSSSGGGSSSSNYTVSVASGIDNGKVTVSPKSASKGDTVTITVTPDDGYELGTLTVTDKNGDKISVTDKGNGKYTFTMPAGKVTIDATFTEVAETPETPDQVGPFEDVSTDDWFADAVQYMLDNGMMNGVTESTFAPNTTTTRGMIVTMLHRLEDEPSAAASSFTDVAADAYYGNAVAWAAANSIVNGMSDTIFAPNNAITREQMAAILYRYAQYKGYDTSVGGMSLAEYTDADQISSYATTAMQWANENGLITGRTDTTLVPQGTATRAEVATILMRFCENIAK